MSNDYENLNERNVNLIIDNINSIKVKPKKIVIKEYQNKGIFELRCTNTQLQYLKMKL